jgi:hypothetical protein
VGVPGLPEGAFDALWAAATAQDGGRVPLEVPEDVSNPEELAGGAVGDGDGLLGGDANGKPANPASVVIERRVAPRVAVP